MAQEHFPESAKEGYREGTMPNPNIHVSDDGLTVPSITLACLDSNENHTSATDQVSLGESSIHSLRIQRKYLLCSAPFPKPTRAPDATQALYRVCKIQDVKKRNHAVVRASLALANERCARRERTAVKQCQVFRRSPLTKGPWRSRAMLTI